MSKYTILLVDDLEENLSSTRDLLHRWGYAVDTASNGDEAIEHIKNGLKEYAVVILDYQMPGKSGTETAKEIRNHNAEVVLLVYSAYPSIESLTETIRAGVLNFISKNEEVSYLKNAIEKACIEYEKVRKVTPPLTPSEATKLIASIGMVGQSNLLAQVASQVIKFRNSKASVLILGETGSGKEMIAQALHVGHKSSFFVVNSSSLNSNSLANSELFGHEKGAFTGAVMRKVGIFESARGGTIYFDEMQHMDISAQTNLLRAFREKKIRRVGGNQEEELDFRILASSWPNINEMMDQNKILRDFYHRVSHLIINVPPLRERPEDIEPLVAMFCEKHFKETGVRKYFLARTIRLLEQHSWPGNVAELGSSVIRALTVTDKSTVDESSIDTSAFTSGNSTSLGTYEQLEARQVKEKRQLLLGAIRSAKTPRQAAQKVGLKPSTFHSLLTRLGVRAELDKE